MDPSGGKGTLARVQKQLVRTKAKVLQNIGKAKKTTDDRFEDLVADFLGQQAVVQKLQKELKSFIISLRAFSEASDSLCSVVRETCESDWIKADDVDSSLRCLSNKYKEFMTELVDGALNGVTSYVEQCSLLKEKIGKKKRKLIDYDDARHYYESVCNSKRGDESKTKKAKESLEEAERLYSTLNDELLEELPQFYLCRVEVLTLNLGRLFTAQHKFHLESAQVMSSLKALVDQVKRPVMTQSHGHRSADKGKPQRNSSCPAYKAPDVPKTQRYSSEDLIADYVFPDTVYEDPIDKTPPPVSKLHLSASAGHLINDTTPHLIEERRSLSEEPIAGELKAKLHPHSAVSAQGGTLKDRHSYDSNRTEFELLATGENIYENMALPMQASASPGSAGSTISCTQVVTIQAYKAQNADELSFEVGEIITVIVDEKCADDDGWLMGVTLAGGQRGLFPANFTQPYKNVRQRQLLT